MRRNTLKYIVIVAFWGLAFAFPHFSVAQEKRITIQENEISLESAFEQIEKQTGYSIAYKQSGLDVKKRISLSLRSIGLEKALTEVLKSTGLSYRINGYHIILVAKAMPKTGENRPQPVKQTVTVSGRIADAETGEVLIGCSVAELNRIKEQRLILTDYTA